MGNIDFKNREQIEEDYANACLRCIKVLLQNGFTQEEATSVLDPIAALMVNVETLYYTQEQLVKQLEKIIKKIGE